MLRFEESRPRPLTVFELNRRAQSLLESEFSSVLVQGEISRPTKAASGHIYFGLKDKDARVDCVLFATRARFLKVPLTEGLEVVVRGQVSLYPAQGRFQILSESVEPAGEGALRQALIRLKAKLDAEGLTDPERKRPLPALPRAIGVVTSPTGAAIKDITETIWRRFPQMPIHFCPARVQGVGASLEIAAGLRRLQRIPEVDVIIFGRGGGSVEDLWAFNDEALARAIANSSVPTISAVGHEIDVTISDFVADVRALTPTAAAELACPVFSDLREDVIELKRRLMKAAREISERHRNDLIRVARSLSRRTLERRIADERQGLDTIERRLRRGSGLAIRQARDSLVGVQKRLRASSPGLWVKHQKETVQALGIRGESAIRSCLRARSAGLAPLARALDALNPLAVLSRGFQIVLVDGPPPRRFVRGAKDLDGAERLRIVFASGADLLARPDGEVPRTLPLAMALDARSSSSSGADIVSHGPADATQILPRAHGVPPGPGREA